MGKQGGTRRNAGRKKRGETPVVLSLSFRPDVLKVIADLSINWGINRSQAVSKAVLLIAEKQPFIRVEPAPLSKRKEKVKFRQGKPAIDALKGIKRILQKGGNLADIVRRAEFLDHNHRYYNPVSLAFLRALSRVDVPQVLADQTPLFNVTCSACGTKIPVDPIKLLNQ